MDAVKFLEPHVECPICTEIPRDGVMLQCLNGHNLCAVCKDKIGEDAKCPLGRYEYCSDCSTCDFSNPLMTLLVFRFLMVVIIICGPPHILRKAAVYRTFY